MALSSGSGWASCSVDSVLMRLDYHDCDSVCNTFVKTYAFLIMNVNTFSERLRAAREEAGLNQGQLAKSCGLKSQSAIANMESGRAGSRNTGALAHALHVEAYWLETGKGPRRRDIAVAATGLPDDARRIIEAALAKIAAGKVPPDFTHAALAQLKAIAAMPVDEYVVKRATSTIPISEKKKQATG